MTLAMATTRPKAMTPRMLIAGTAVPLVLLAGWLVFYLVNSAGVATETATVRVVSKQTVTAGTTYRQNQVGGKTYIQSDQAGDALLVEIELDGRRASSFVSRSVFDQVGVGTEVQVSYRRLRLSGRIEILEIAVAAGQ